MTLILRPYQQKGIDLARAEFANGHKRVVLVMPTGSGKTATASAIVASAIAKGKKVLWLAHASELIAQARERLLRDGAGTVGLVKAGEDPDPLAQIQVASIQTLLARDPSTWPANIGFVVVDECHHLVAEQWSSVAKHYEGTPMLGLTATPERADGKPLGSLFGAMVTPIDVAELTQLGHLVPAKVFVPGGKVGPDQLASSIVDEYLLRANGKRAFIFVGRVAHAEEVAKHLCDAGVSAVAVSGETPADERAAAVEAFRAGTVQALVNVQVFTEGTDVPEAEAVILARKFTHASQYLQAVGRVLRPAPGKSEAIIIDLAGSAEKHGYPDDPREYSLDGGIQLAKKAAKKRAKEAKAAKAAMCEPPEVIGCGLTELARDQVTRLWRKRMAKQVRDADRLREAGMQAEYAYMVERIEACRSQAWKNPNAIGVQFRNRYGRYAEELALGLHVVRSAPPSNRNGWRAVG